MWKLAFVLALLIFIFGFGGLLKIIGLTISLFFAIPMIIFLAFLIWMII